LLVDPAARWKDHVPTLRDILKRVRDEVSSSSWGKAALQALASRRLIPRRVWMRVQPIGSHAIKTSDGLSFTYVADHEDVLSRYFVWTNLATYEPATIRLVGRLAQESSVFLNAGAHTGLFTLVASAANPLLRTMAFEPNPTVFEWLSTNIRANHLEERVTARRQALSNAPGSATLFVPAFSARSSLTKEFNPAAQQEEVVVQLATADEECLQRPVDFALLDVEGHEIEVIEGMTEILSTDHPHLIVECQYGEDARLARLRSTLTERGYQSCFHISSSGALKNVEYGFEWEAEELNFLFLHPAHRFAQGDLLDATAQSGGL
jgi:FkbM family methyltransferase